MAWCTWCRAANLSSRPRPTTRTDWRATSSSMPMACACRPAWRATTIEAIIAGFKALLRAGPAGRGSKVVFVRMKCDRLPGAALRIDFKHKLGAFCQGDIRDRRGNAGQIYYGNGDDRHPRDRLVRAAAARLQPRAPRRRRQGRGVHPRQARLRIAVAARPGHGNLRPVRAGVPRARIAARFRPGVGGLRDRVHAEPRRARPAAPRPWSTASSGCCRRASFDISLGCSGYVYGLAVATAFMQANGLRSGLLFTADPYSKILDPQDWDTESAVPATRRR